MPCIEDYFYIFSGPPTVANINFRLSYPSPVEARCRRTSLWIYSRLSYDARLVESCLNAGIVLRRGSVEPPSRFLIATCDTPDACTRSVCVQAISARAARVVTEAAQGSVPARARSRTLWDELRGGVG